MPTGENTTRVSIVVEKTTQAELGRIAEKEGESVSAVGARMINVGLKAYQRREKEARAT